MDKVEEEATEERELTKLVAAIQTGKWTKNDPDLKPYFDLRAGPCMTEELILRIERIFPPESRRNKIFKPISKDTWASAKKCYAEVLVTRHEHSH